jgi:putative SOS response-associated peptidase YedK
MCCRYYMEMSPELRPIIEEANRSALKERIVNKLGRPMVTEGEVCPTNIVPVIAPNRSGARTVFPMVWGFTLASLLFSHGQRQDGNGQHKAHLKRKLGTSPLHHSGIVLL